MNFYPPPKKYFCNMYLDFQKSDLKWAFSHTFAIIQFDIHETIFILAKGFPKSITLLEGKNSCTSLIMNTFWYKFLFESNIELNICNGKKSIQREQIYFWHRKLTLQIKFCLVFLPCCLCCAPSEVMLPWKDFQFAFPW